MYDGHNFTMIMLMAICDDIDWRCRDDDPSDDDNHSDDGQDGARAMED